MSRFFEELDYRPTPIGALSLRRRYDVASATDIFEIMLGDEHLMSSRFTASEIALAHLAIEALPDRTAISVAVGGLGLGYTAQAVLEHDAVASLIVIEMLAPVIDWHENALLPMGRVLTDDARCRLVEGDFFALAASGDLDPSAPGSRFDAVLLDIDHSPVAHLDARSTPFYEVDGLRALAATLNPGGIFALWSNERPDAAFVERLETVFADAWAEEIVFHNPLQDKPFTQTVYLARAAATPA